MIGYLIQDRPGGLYAVLRTGPRGGVRLVAVYRSRGAARAVLAELLAHTKLEV